MSTILKDDPEAPLWVGVGTKNHNKPMSYDCLRMLLRKIAKGAGVKKDVNPHNFRHSRATDLANWMTEAQMDKFFGWVIGSRPLDGRPLDIKAALEAEERERELLKKIPKHSRANGIRGKRGLEKGQGHLRRKIDP